MVEITFKPQPYFLLVGVVATVFSIVAIAAQGWVRMFDYFDPSRKPYDFGIFDLERPALQLQPARVLLILTIIFGACGCAFGQMSLGKWLEPISWGLALTSSFSALMSGAASPRLKQFEGYTATSGTRYYIFDRFYYCVYLLGFASLFYLGLLIFSLRRRFLDRNKVAGTLPSHQRQSSKDSRMFLPSKEHPVYDIFISLRFGEALEEATALKKLLADRGLSVFLCAVPEGESIADAIIAALDTCKLVVILATRTYGAKTASTFSTYEELNYIVEQRKPYFLVKMCEQYAEARTRFHLPSHISYYPWLPRSEAERLDVPQQLVDNIEDRLRRLLQSGVEAATPTAEDASYAAMPGMRAEPHSAARL